MEFKFCPKCKTKKEINLFSKVKTRYDGLCPYCKLCNKKVNAKNYSIEYHKKYYKKHKNKIIQYNTIYNKTHKKNSFIGRMYVHNKLKSLGKIDIEKLLQKLAFYGYKCLYCGSTEKLTLDHKIAKNNGGKNILANIALACWECNKKKGIQDYKIWLSTL